MAILILKKIIIPVGQISLIVFFFSAIYIAIKYRTLAFWWEGGKYEKLFVQISAIIFLLCSMLGVVVAVLFGE